MSDSLIAFHPSMEEPSNIKPSVSASSSMALEHIVRCCHLPFGSVKRRSTQSISSSLILERMVSALFAIGSPSLKFQNARTKSDEPGDGRAATMRIELVNSDCRAAAESQEPG